MVIVPAVPLGFVEPQVLFLVALHEAGFPPYSSGQIHCVNPPTKGFDGVVLGCAVEEQ